VRDTPEGVYVSFGAFTEDGNNATAPKEIGTLEEFTEQLSRFNSLIQTVVNGCYEAECAETPNATLFLKPQVTIKVEGFSPYDIFGLGRRFKKKQEKKQEVEEKKVTFDEIGGQEKAKKEVEGLSFALKNPELYKRWGTKPPKGIMMHGPPGNGKTLLAEALASSAEAKFYHIKLSDLVSKWYGEAEQKVQEVFDNAKKDERAILYFDEIDALAPDRDGAHEATRRMVAVLLYNMDGIGSSDKIMCIASTNRPGIIDPALLRPGRFDRLVEVPCPDREGRRKILDIHMHKAKETTEDEIFSSIDYDSVIKSTDGFSGADIAELIRRTLEEKVSLAATGQEPEPVSTQDILAEIEKYERKKKQKEQMGFHRKETSAAD